MTEIFEVDAGTGSGYRSMTLVNDDDWAPSRWKALESLTSIASEWVAPAIRFLDPGETGLEDDSKSSPSSTDTDMPWLGGTGILLVSQRFVDVVGGRFDPHGEFLPCECVQGSFYIFHCTHELDAIDLSESDLDRDTNGRITSVRRIAFRGQFVNNDLVFRCRFRGYSDIYLGRNVRDAMMQAPIKGATATLLWREGERAKDVSFGAFLDSPKKGSTRDESK